MSNFRAMVTIFVLLGLSTQVQGSALPSFETKLIGAFFECTDLLLGSQLSHENSEAFIPAEAYGSPNDRPLSEYEAVLGWQFSEVIHRREVDYLDVGGGYGMAVFRKVRNSPLSRGTVINAQDNWKDILGATPLPSYLNTDALTRLLARAGLALPDYFNRSPDRLRSLLAEARKELGGRFDYRAGLAEQVLPVLQKQFDVVSDVFGAYYYSVNRVELLNRYYQALKPGGQAFVVIGSQDPKPGGAPYIHSAQTHVLVGGRFLTLESFLVQEFPKVFKIDRIERNWAGDGKTVVLQVSRDESVADLNLTPRVLRTYVSRTGNHPIYGEWEKRVPKVVVVLQP